MAILKPLPFLPSRRSAGIRQSSMINSQVEEPRIPIFFSCLPTEKPGSVRSTMKAEISLRVFLGFFLSGIMPVTAMMMNTLA